MSHVVTQASVHEPQAEHGPRRVPGESGIWLFILLDMLIFVEMFIIFTVYRADDRVPFERAQEAMIPAFGLAYTLLLLTSSWCVVMAVNAARRREFHYASRLVNWGFMLGAAFALLKVVEYAEKFISGYGPTSNDFLMFYFVMTFVHLLHATAGLFVLRYMQRQIRVLERDWAPHERAHTHAIETGAVYWHMVDLLWIVLFALFYLRG